MNTVLLVEDDPNITLSLKTYFHKEGLTLLTAATLAEAKESMAQTPSVLIVDWNLPDGQGIDLIRTLRYEGNSIPILLLTARTELIDKILGLETGANDYITKPFEPRELLTRVRVQLRNKMSALGICDSKDLTGKELPKDPCHLGVTLNPNSREVKYHGRSVELTKMEYELLKTLLENPSRVYSREELLNQVWGYDNYSGTRTVDMHILQLRNKMHESLFETVRGVGYRMAREAAAA